MGAVTKAAALLAAFQKEYGEAVGSFGGKLVNADRVPTGLFPFDLATGGGFPRGRCSIVFGPESSSKCHAPGTKILMFDGTLKNVEDIQPGDLVMGIDSKPRTVLQAGKGYGRLYRVTPVKGADSFVVNAEHVLSLICVHDQGQRRRGDIVNISVEDYLKQSRDWKIYHHLWRTGVEFEAKELPLEPYWLGLWLGDGAERVPVITTDDQEIVDYLRDHADRHGWRLAVYTAEDRCPSYATVGDVRGTPLSGRPVVPFDWLERLGLLKNKHVPQAYKTSSRAQRLQLLAGLLDSDGSGGTSSSMGFVNTNLRLCEDVLFLARSLGFYASLSPRDGHFAVYLSGDFAELPLKLARRRPGPRRRAGSPLTSRFRVEEAGEGAYYGFVLDGDHLYLLDSFIVNHNTNMVLLAIASHQKIWPDQVNVFIDVEHSFDPHCAQILGVDTEQLIVVSPSYAEQVVDMVESFLLAEDIGIVAIDSLAAMITTQEIDSSAEKANVGGAALVVGRLARKTVRAIAEAEGQGRSPTLIYINQTRFRIGLQFGNPETMPGGQAPRYQTALWVRVAGKDLIDSKVSQVMPVIKEVQFVIKKWKVPIVAASGKFNMVTYPHQGLMVGETDDWNTVSDYLKEFGQLAKKDKGQGWLMLGEEYPTLQACKDRVYADKMFGLEVRRSIIQEVMKAGTLALKDEL
jgi:recombination protein RecA